MSDVPSLTPAMPDPAPAEGVAVPARRDLEAFPLAPLTPVREATPPKRRGIALGIAAVVAVAAIAAFTVIRSNSGPFPEQIGIYERMHDASSRSFEDQLESIEMRDITFEGAMYAEARSSVPALVVIVMRVDPAAIRATPLADFMRGASGGFAGSGAGSIDVDAGVSDTRAGVEYFCAPVEVTGAAGVFGDSVACGWKASDHLGMAFVTHTTDVRGALDQTEVVFGSLHV